MAASIFVDPCISLSHRQVSLVEGGAETRDTLKVGGRVPCGVTLLGTTESVPAKAAKVKRFSANRWAGEPRRTLRGVADALLLTYQAPLRVV